MRVVAKVDSLAQLERAARAAGQAGWRTVGVCSPAYDDRMMAVAAPTRSPVAASGVMGGVVGLLVGVALTVGTVRQWPGLIVSGKPLISVPPILIITFELTILFASIGAVASFLVASRHARRSAHVGCDETTTDCRFSLLLESVSSGVEVNDEVMQRLDIKVWRRV